MDKKDTILARTKYHKDTKHREKNYTLRLIAGNYLDITQYGQSSVAGVQPDGTWPDVEVFDWEKGRHNPISTATQIQAKSMTFTAPDVAWIDIPASNPELVSTIRREWFLHQYEALDLQWAYRQVALDLIITGEATLLAGVKDDSIFLEYADAKYITWDPVYKENYRKRFVFIDKCLPLSDALHYYPKLKEHFPQAMVSQLETTIILTCYYSKDTVAVLYGSEFIDGPKPNPYGKIPATRVSLIHMPGFAHPIGMVENQIGTYMLDVQLQRYFREVALRGASPIGVARGNIEEGSLDDIQSGEECALIRFTENGDFNWRPGAEITNTSIQLWEQVQQLGNSESGVNAFQQNRTDVKVDFATQLNYMAAQSGIQSQDTVQQLEIGIKDSINLLMDIGAKYAPSISLRVGETLINFDPATPISSLLGSDGKIVLKPNSTQFKSQAQKLQEVAMFGQVLTQMSQMSEPMQIPFVQQVLDAAEIENPDVWTQAIKQAQEQQAAQLAIQQQQAMMQANKAVPTNQEIR